MGIGIDITERKNAEALLKRFNEELEQKVKGRTEELNASLEEKNNLLKEKEILLREIHHRVRNTLQMALSAMDRERRKDPDERVQTALIRTENRLAVISFVFDRVYQSKDLTKAPFKTIIRSLVSRLRGIYSIDPKRIRITENVQDIELGIDLAIPLALLANELVSNAIQHAFPGDRSGEIAISACEKEGRIILVVKDTGAGCRQELFRIRRHPPALPRYTC